MKHSKLLGFLSVAVLRATAAVPFFCLLPATAATIECSSGVSSIEASALLVAKPAANAPLLLKLAQVQSRQKLTVPVGGAGKSFLLAESVAQMGGYLAAKDILSSIANKDSTVSASIRALNIIYAPVGDDEGDGDLSRSLREAEDKSRTAAKGLGEYWKAPGVSLFIRSAIYHEPVSRKIAVPLVCRSGISLRNALNKMEERLK